jgi:hypothetical protein
MLIDKALEFIDGALKDTTAESAVVKFGAGEHKLSANRHGAGFWNVMVNSVEGAAEAAGTITLKHCETEDGEYQEVPGMVITLAGLKAGAKASLRLPAGTKQFLKVEFSTKNTARVTSYLGDPIAEL